MTCVAMKQMSEDVEELYKIIDSSRKENAVLQRRVSLLTNRMKKLVNRIRRNTKNDCCWGIADLIEKEMSK